MELIQALKELEDAVKSFVKDAPSFDGERVLAVRIGLKMGRLIAEIEKATGLAYLN